MCWLEPEAIKKIRVLKKEPTRALIPFTEDGVQRYIDEYRRQQGRAAK